MSNLQESNKNKRSVMDKSKGQSKNLKINKTLSSNWLFKHPILQQITLNWHTTLVVKLPMQLPHQLTYRIIVSQSTLKIKCLIHSFMLIIRKSDWHHQLSTWFWRWSIKSRLINYTKIPVSLITKLRSWFICAIENQTIKLLEKSRTWL